MSKNTSTITIIILQTLSERLRGRHCVTSVLSRQAWRYLDTETV